MNDSIYDGHTGRLSTSVPLRRIDDLVFDETFEDFMLAQWALAPWDRLGPAGSRCGAQSPNIEEWFCSKKRAHTGDHVAHDVALGYELARWR